MNRAGGMPHQIDGMWVATLAGDVRDKIAYGRTYVLRTGGPLELRRQPVRHVDADKSVADGPHSDIVVKGQSVWKLPLTAGKAAAVDKQQDWPRRRTDVLALTETIRQAIITTVESAEQATGMTLPGPLPEGEQSEENSQEAP